MRILIAGCGYVGIRAAKKLHELGHEVAGIRRTVQPSLPYISWVTGDLTHPESIKLPGKLDAVLLAAGLRRDTDDRYQQLFIHGYGQLLALLKQNGHPIQRVVMVSTTGVFAERDGGWVDEYSPVNRDTSPGGYYLSAEELVHQCGWTSSVIRFSGIYGPDRIRLIREVRDQRARRLPPPPDYLNQLHADDAAGAIVHVMNLGNPDPVYIASDRDPADRNQVLQWISDQLKMGKIPDADDYSNRPVKRSGNKRCNSSRLVQSGFNFTYPTFREGYATLLLE